MSEDGGVQAGPPALECPHCSTDLRVQMQMMVTEKLRCPNCAMEFSLQTGARNLVSFGDAQLPAELLQKEAEEGWRNDGSLLLGVRVRRKIPPTGTTPQLTENATVWGWLPAGESNFNEESGLPAALWRVRFDNTAFGDQDLEESEVHDSWALYKKWTAEEELRADQGAEAIARAGRDGGTWTGCSGKMDRIFSRVVEAVHDAEDGYERQADGTSALPEGFHIEMYVNARLDVMGNLLHLLLEHEEDDEESQIQREELASSAPSDVWASETEAFPDTMVRFVAPEKPDGAIPDNVIVVSTSAAPNGKFFTVQDIADAIGTSLNLKLDGYPTGAFCGQGWLGRISPVVPGARVWDLTPPARDPVLAKVMIRAKTVAFAMGLHPRLGAQAGMSVMEMPEILRMISDFASEGVMPEMGAEAAAAIARDPVLTAEAEDIRARIPIFNTQWVS
mmetsp:Transcript_2838/g.6442  ORF Transcript_2838/g.6442 Transcript_2838/m.6442 type:complete len:448 (+) Transcript_2838:250-1593(+)